MDRQKFKWVKISVIGLMILIVLSLHYFTGDAYPRYHSFYRMLFYLPLVLSSFWFGLRGAVTVSVVVSALFLPYVLMQWQGFSQRDFDRLLEGGLYVTVALILGFLVEKEKAEHRAKIESERLAAVGRAVSEIAHDMKSPLMAIGGFVSQVSRKLQLKDPNRKKLDLVVQETSRLESMVKEMLDFGRPLQLQTSVENLNSLAEECVELSLPVAENRGIKIKTEFDPLLTTQRLDKERVRQVIANLITNAIQASSPGGTVWIRTGKERKDAVLNVSDRGCGIREENRAKIFEPFFSTKKEGTGLGLAIVKKIVDAHGGNIFLYPNPEGGVTFSVRIPAEQ
jgi:signal transduction histidine kinase